jgi:hypothetical protein
MPDGIKSEDIDNLVRAVRTHADAKALRKDLYAGLNRATKGVRGEMTDAITDALPRGGGLADQMKSKIRTNTSAKSGKYAGVSLWFKSSGYDIRTLTGNRIRHPVYGNRGVWVDQTAGVDSEAFSGEFDKQKPDIQRAIVNVLEDVARKVTNI